MSRRNPKVKLPVYPPDTIEELLREIRDMVISSTRALDAPHQGAVHNAFALGFQTLREMDIQQRLYGKTYPLLEAERD